MLRKHPYLGGLRESDLRILTYTRELYTLSILQFTERQSPPI